MAPSVHPLAPQPLPAFITSPGSVDYLLIGMAIFLIAFVLAIGLLYLKLHALPDQIAHKSKKIQYEVVCVLGLLAMFTHVQAFWIAGLLLAMIDIPDFSGPLGRMTEALEQIADNWRNSTVGSVNNDNHQREAATLRSPMLVESKRDSDSAAS